MSLLPVELILQVGSAAGFAMVFALLIAAIIWNLGTWYLGLPASSSHTLIGSIIGVGIANAMMHGQDGTSGVDWSKATEIGYALLLSPIIGFAAAAILFLALKFVVHNPALYQAPKGDQPPPWWIRGVLVLTCTGVSFAHGSNDGQKGMGLIMLILIGTVPTAYALNRAMPASQMEMFRTTSAAASAIVKRKAEGYNVLGDPRPAVTQFVSRHKLNEGTFPSLAVLIEDISKQVNEYGSLAKVPAAAVGNTRNDIYLASEALRFLMKDKENELTKDEVATLTAYKQIARRGDQVHSALGQGRGRDRARARHHGRLETHRHYGRREDRQGAPHVRPGRVSRTRGHGDHRARRHVRPAGVHHPCVVVRRRRDDGGQRLGITMVDGAQPTDGLGADAARRDHAVCHPLCAVRQHILNRPRGEQAMRAMDVMVRDVVTASPNEDVDQVIELLAKHDASTLPVVDAEGNVVGMIGDLDLMRRPEIGTEKHHPWWMEAMTPASTLAEEFAKSHGRRVGEVMSTHLISATEDTSLGEIATLLEKHRIKRVPILRNGKLVGMVSRSNLIQALASSHGQAHHGAESDRDIRSVLLSRIGEQDWTDFGSRNIIVTDGVVHLWGLVGSDEERKALTALAEGVPGVVGVSDEMIPAY